MAESRPEAKPAEFALDKRRLRAHFARAADTYDRAAVLQREIADRMLARLDVVKQIPETVLDAGCGTGYCTRALARRYPRARLVGLDLAAPMAARARRAAGWFARPRFVCGDIEALPLPDAAIDLVASNLTLQWCDLARSLRELRRVLRPGGLLMFTSFGPDTLSELRTAWRTADAGVHVHAFLDMHDIGDALLHAGFADPVMDVDRLTMTYPNVEQVLQDLKALGASNAAYGRARALTGKARYARFKAAYEALARDGRIPATYEVVYGHAWAPETARAAPVTFVRRPR